MEGQLAAQQTHTNEQLEALQTEYETLREAAAKAVAEHDVFRKLNLKLRVASLGNSSASASESALQDRCMKAEAKVAEHQKENALLKEIAEDQSRILHTQYMAVLEKEEPIATSAALGPLSFPTLSGRESGLTTQVSPQLGGGLSGLSTSRASLLAINMHGVEDACI